MSTNEWVSWPSANDTDRRSVISTDLSANYWADQIPWLVVLVLQRHGRQSDIVSKDQPLMSHLKTPLPHWDAVSLWPGRNRTPRLEPVTSRLFRWHWLLNISWGSRRRLGAPVSMWHAAVRRVGAHLVSCLRGSRSKPRWVVSLCVHLCR